MKLHESVLMIKALEKIRKRTYNAVHLINIHMALGLLTRISGIYIYCTIYNIIYFIIVYNILNDYIFLLIVRHS